MECVACGEQFNERPGRSLNRTRYPSDVIALVVFWRLRYKLSLGDLPVSGCRKPVDKCSIVQLMPCNGLLRSAIPEIAAISGISRTPQKGANSRPTAAHLHLGHVPFHGTRPTSAINLATIRERSDERYSRVW